MGRTGSCKQLCVWLLDRDAHRMHLLCVGAHHARKRRVGDTLEAEFGVCLRQPRSGSFQTFQNPLYEASSGDKQHLPRHQEHRQQDQRSALPVLRTGLLFQRARQRTLRGITNKRRGGGKGVFKLPQCPGCDSVVQDTELHPHCRIAREHEGCTARCAQVQVFIQAAAPIVCTSRAGCRSTGGRETHGRRIRRAPHCRPFLPPRAAVRREYQVKRRRGCLRRRHADHYRCHSELESDRQRRPVEPIEHHSQAS
mmetsp:Transcript_1954/g.3246  ORF Transcript_1954/g.3246 Transcript_1954/m.3246 type:complete len:253 (-) Transcript_1954:3396-4154(-)